MKASGSSTGSSISVGLGLAPASFGTEVCKPSHSPLTYTPTLQFLVTDLQTIASIVSPSEKSGVDGFKPTRGLISSHGIIPVSQNQDVVGPIARTVKDTALILDAITSVRHDGRSYARSCSSTDLHGVRIGVIRDTSQQVDQAKLDAFQATLALFKTVGAVVIDDVQLIGFEEYKNPSESLKSLVLDTEFKVSMGAYLQSLTVNPQRLENLEDLIDAIKIDVEEEYPSRNVAIMERALATSVNASNYQQILARQEYHADVGGLEGAMNGHNCTVLIAPAGSIIFQNFAAMGGNPVISVPLGFYPQDTKVKRDGQSGFFTVAPGIPFSLFLYGKRFDEQALFRVANAFEQARLRSKPYLFPKVDLKDFTKLPQTGSKL